MLLRPYEVVLVDRVVLRCGHTFRISPPIEIRNVGSDLHPVPINHTGPADSERIPRPLNAVICFDPPLSRSWSASQTHVPWNRLFKNGTFRPYGKSALPQGMRWTSR